MNAKRWAYGFVSSYVGLVLVAAFLGAPSQGSGGVNGTAISPASVSVTDDTGAVTITLDGQGGTLGVEGDAEILGDAYLFSSLAVGENMTGSYEDGQIQLWDQTGSLAFSANGSGHDFFMYSATGTVTGTLDGTTGAIVTAGASADITAGDDVIATDTVVAGTNLLLAADSRVGPSSGSRFYIGSATNAFAIEVGATADANGISLGDMSLAWNTSVGHNGAYPARIRGSRVTITDNVVTDLARLTVAAGEAIGGMVTVTAYATDGVDYQATTVVARFAAVNKGGALTINLVEAGETDATACSSGTLTVTLTATADTNAIDLEVQANTSLSPTGMRADFQIQSLGPGAISCN